MRSGARQQDRNALLDRTQMRKGHGLLQRRLSHPCREWAPVAEMSRFEVAQSFIDLSRGLTSAADLDALLQSITREMGFDHFALIHHVDLSSFGRELSHMESGQLIALSDYPEEWIAEYIDDNIVAEDPVLLASQRTNDGFVWDDLPKIIDLKSVHLDQLERGRRAGIGNGFTVPSNVVGEASGSCNFVVKTGRDLPYRELMMAQLVGSYAFQAGRTILKYSRTNCASKTKLTPRQIECIALAGKGKSDWEIAKILGIAESTVKDYIDDARGRYGVSKRIQLVIRAVYDGHLPLADLLR
jgi:LuxR family transcriptional regulator, quorum-sensing system regulator CciR